MLAWRKDFFDKYQQVITDLKKTYLLKNFKLSKYYKMIVLSLLNYLRAILCNDNKSLGYEVFKLFFLVSKKYLNYLQP